MAVFSLNEVRSLQVENKDTNFTSWSEDLYKSNFAENYVFLGSVITKYTFSTDVDSLPGNNVAQWNGLTSTGNHSYANDVNNSIGYLSNNPTLVQKFDVTNEVNSSLPTIPSDSPAYGFNMGIVNSPTAFYANGGTPGAFGKTNINRMPFSDETLVNIGTGAFGRHRQSTFSTPPDDVGYIFSGERYGGGGALDYDEMSKIERFTFSTETIEQIANSTPSSYIWKRRGTVQSSQYGYLIGGIITPPVMPPPHTETGIVSRYEFKTETYQNTTPGAHLPQNKQSVSAGFRSSDYGYYGGAYSRNAGTHYSNIYKLNFETETLHGPVQNFYTNVGGVNALLGTASAIKPNHNHMQYAYFWGGTLSTGAPSAYGYIQKYEFATGTSGPFNPFTSQKGGAVISTHEHAWKMGGEGPTPPNPARKSWVYRYDFSSDNEQIRSGTHPLPTGVSNGLSYQTRAGDRGYFSQFWPGPDTIIRQENQTETLSSLTGTLNNLTFNFTGQCTKSYGYSFGGSQPDNSVPAGINRFDFSTESYTSIPATLDTAVKFGAAAASPQRAHIFGGIGVPGSYTNNIDQFEYSTETASDFPLNMPYSAYAVGAVSNTQEAFLHGGVIPNGPPWASSRKNRLTFSDGTLSTLTSGSNIGHRGDDGCTNSPFK
jgi:hypothetical protein